MTDVHNNSKSSSGEYDDNDDWLNDSFNQAGNNI